MKSQKIDYKYNLQTYASFFKGEGKSIFILLVVAIILEGAGVLDNFILKIVVDNLTTYSSGDILIDALTKILFIALFSYIGLIVLRLILSGARLHFLSILDAKAISAMKKKFFNHIIKLSNSFHTTHKTGSLISRLTRAGGAVEGLTDTFFFNFIPFFVKAIWITIFISVYSFIAAIIILVSMLLFIAFTYYKHKRQEKMNQQMNDAEDSEKALVSDVLTNIDSVMLFGKERLINKKHQYKVKHTTKKQLTYWLSWISVEIGQAIILNAGFITVVSYSVYAYLQGDITLGSILFIFSSFWSLIGNVYAFSGGLRQFSRIMADFEDLFQYGKEESEIKNCENPVKKTVKKGYIDFNNISFSYNKKRVIKNISLHIKSGEKIALVGHSGSGKTTLVKLLYRLYDVNKGNINVDGTDIKNYDFEFLRSEMSVVPQEAILFDDTVFNNIAFANPRATKKDVFNAIKFAQLDKVIANFPKKEKTIVGERGVKLSGGEKQRVSIARALIADKKILVLDEATSALDSHTEHQIQKDLFRLMKGRTSIIIAHRLSTIMKADRIVVMDKGRIVEIGSHNELLKKKGAYYTLWQLQKGGFIE